MIDGVQVLSQEAIYSAGLKPVGTAILTVVVLLISFLVMAIKDENFYIFVCGVFISLFLGVVSGFIFALTTGEPTGRYEYKVLIDDSVSMTEFYEKYDLISVDGQIYTIRDKEVNE